MSNKLAKYEPRKQDTDLIKEGQTSFLTPLKLMSASSKPVKARKAQIGDWFVGKETNLGSEAEFIVIEGRPHARQTDENGMETLAESFVVSDKVFQDIKAGRAKYEKGFGWGFDYLLWSTKQRTFCVYFCQKSAKMAAGEFEDRLGKHVSATSYEKNFNTGNSAMIPRLTTLEDEPAAMFSDADLEAALTIFRDPKPRVGKSEDAEGGEGAEDPKAPAAKAGGRAARKAA